MKIKIFILLFCCLWSAENPAQITHEVTKEKVEVWSTVNWSSETDKFFLNSTSLRMSLADDTWKVFADFNLKSLSTKKNWLQQAYLSYGLKPFSIKLGRFNTTTTYVPAPSKQTTVSYARTPYSYTALGMQIQVELPADFDLKMDLTFSSPKYFSDSSQFRSWETSWCLNKRFTPGNISLMTQINPKDQIYGINSSYSNQFWNTTTSFYLKNTTGSLNYGGYIFSAVTPASWFELHTQIDYQNKKGVNRTIITNGVRIAIKWCKICTTSITGDAKTFLNSKNETKTNLVAKFQLVFGFKSFF